MIASVPAVRADQRPDNPSDEAHATIPSDRVRCRSVGDHLLQCSLLASEFRELFVFHLDSYGSLLSVTYTVPIMECGNTNQVRVLRISPIASMHCARVSRGK